MTPARGTPPKAVALISVTELMTVGPRAIPTRRKIMTARTPITVSDTMFPIRVDILFESPP
jgi:hypothetical protein